MYQSLLPTRSPPQMQWQIHLNLHYIIRYITNKVCNVSDKYHIDNGPRTNAGSCLKEYNYKNDRIDKHLPRSKAPSNKSADSKIHCAEWIHAKL